MLSPTDWFVIAAGIAAIAWVTWYFFAAVGPAASAAGAAGGTQEITVAVRGGYDPATIRVRAGAPVRLVFDRQETSSCSEEVVLPDFGVRKFLPTGKQTTIEVTPPAAGTYEFMCGMSMLRGTLVAE